MQRAEQTRFGIQTFVNIVPRNPLAAAVNFDMLGIIFFSLVLGAALGFTKTRRAGAMISLLEGLGDAMVVIIDFAMKLAPVGVACLIFSVTARFGFDLLTKLGFFVVVVLFGLAFHQIVIFSILVKFFGRLSPLKFFKAIRTIMVTAFSTSSSNATLPTTMRVTEQELKVPKEICGFVLPLGATMNMNGTALFEGSRSCSSPRSLDAIWTSPPKLSWWSWQC
jgi:DAACS family dicarboxylate/amino acid:cation (Na+ or H+) symporter